MQKYTQKVDYMMLTRKSVPPMKILVDATIETMGINLNSDEAVKKIRTVLYCQILQLDGIIIQKGYQNMMNYIIYLVKEQILMVVITTKQLRNSSKLVLMKDQNGQLPLNGI